MIIVSSGVNPNVRMIRGIALLIKEIVVERILLLKMVHDCVAGWISPPTRQIGSTLALTIMDAVFAGYTCSIRHYVLFVNLLVELESRDAGRWHNDMLLNHLLVNSPITSKGSLGREVSLLLG